MMPGPDLPPELQLIEGPLVTKKGPLEQEMRDIRDQFRCVASFYVNADTRVAPTQCLVELRHSTSKDSHLLDKLHEHNEQHCGKERLLQHLECEAQKEVLRRRPPKDTLVGAPDTKDIQEQGLLRRLRERLLKTSYNTRGKRQKQDDLFPKLVEERA